MRHHAMKKILLSLTVCALTSLAVSFSSAADDSASSVTLAAATVTGATNMSAKPHVTSESTLPAGKLKVKDLVVGKGAAANPTSTVTVQYVGVRYADGKQFDSSWDRGGQTSFSLRKVVKGFTEGIGGNEEGVAPMKVGGRRIMIVPAEMGYGDRGTPDGAIPPDASIVFVVDLLGVK